MKDQGVCMANAVAVVCRTIRYWKGTGDRLDQHRSSSHNYAKRVKGTFGSVKATILVLDLHCSITTT